MKAQTSALGASGRKVESQVKKKYRRRVRLLERAVLLAQEVITQSNVYPGEKQEIVCAALLGRLMRAVEAGGLLTVRGLEHDATVSVRVSLELLAYLKRSAEDSNFVKEYLLSNLVRRLKIVRGGLKLSNLDAAQISEYKKIEAELAQQVEKFSAKELKFEQVFDKAKMSDHYNTIYRLTSHAVHSGPRVLDDLAISKNGVVAELDFGPKTQRAEMHLFTLTEFLLDGCQYYASLVNVDIKKKASRISRDLSKDQPTWS